MTAVISGAGKSWSVDAGNRMFSGFSSCKWATVFAENMGYVIWLDPDV